MKKNGFTLVELMGVIIVLGIISVLVYPAIETMVKGSKEKIYNAQIVLIENALEQYATMHRDELPKNDGEFIKIDLSQLKADGLVDEDIENPLTGEPFTEEELNMIITKYNNNYSYQVNK